MSAELQNAGLPEKKKGGGLIIALLSLGLVGAGGYAFYQSNEAKKNEEAILEKRDQVVKELEALQKDYDEAVTVSKQNADELADAKARIAQYIDSLKNMKADINVLFKYRDQVNVLKKERNRLLAINDSLRKYNVKVTQEEIAQIYENEKAYQKHRKTAHFKKYIEQTENIIENKEFINIEGIKLLNKGNLNYVK